MAIANGQPSGHNEPKTSVSLGATQGGSLMKTSPKAKAPRTSPQPSGHNGNAATASFSLGSTKHKAGCAGATGSCNC